MRDVEDLQTRMQRDAFVGFIRYYTSVKCERELDKLLALILNVYAGTSNFLVNYVLNLFPF